jgi:hypothetical protein
MRQRLTFLFLLAALQTAGAQNLLSHPYFDSGTDGWDAFWSRDANQGDVSVAAGKNGPAAQVRHRGARDWSFANTARIPLQPGEGYQFSAWVKKVSGTGSLQLSVVLRDGDRVTEWMYAVKTVSEAPDWVAVTGRFLVPPGVTSAQFRFTGDGPSQWLAGSPTLIRTLMAPAPAVTAPLTVTRQGLSLTLAPGPRTLTFTAGSAVYTFDASLLLGAAIAVKTTENQIIVTLADPSGTPLSATLGLDGGVAVLTINGTAMDSDVSFPGPLLARAGQSWVLPLNEGLMVPASLPAAMRYEDWVLYGGHGLCMPFVGLTDGTNSLLAVAETPDDARLRLRTDAAGSGADFTWQPSRGSWRYERRLRLVPVAGDYVAVAKAYRAYAQSKGLVVTLKEKAERVPQVDRLVGAVDLWYWKDAPTWTRDDSNAAEFGRQLKKLGVDRVLWSQQQSGATVAGLNGLGFLTGRYDIYQDVWGPDNPNKWVNRDGWPDDLVLEPDGRPMRGWVDRINGKDYPGGVISSGRSLVWEKKKVPLDLADHAYGARFLDTVTASPLREDWSLAHPLSRTDDKANKLEMLAWLSRDEGLVVGSETGFDFAVPALHYFEGMMSLGQFRLPDSGYDLTSAKTPTPEFLEFQVGPKYRIPLFELVYHDCVVSYWYWGDSSNRVPELWDERDTFNALYGTGPLWIVDPPTWSKYRDRFVQSYRSTAVARHTGYSEMTGHVFLTDDHTVQRTTFADGTVVTANFGRQPWSDGTAVPPRSWVAKFADGTTASELTP